MPESDLDIFNGLQQSRTRQNAPAEEPEKKRRGLKVTLATVLILLLLIVGVGGYFGLRFLKSMDDAPTISDSDAFPEDTNRPAEWVAPEEGDAASPAPVNFLLLGSDSRGESGTDFDNLGDRADVIMVAHVTPDRKTVEVMSIMRDLWVEIPGHGENKVNSALSSGGVPLLTQTVEKLIDQRIDHVAIIDFEGFKGLTDALGGVPITNEREFTAAQTGGPYYFAAGPLTLDGDQALVYVRERYAFPDGDYQRVRNQRTYLKGLLDKTASWETISNPVKLAQTMEAFAPYINRTSGITPSNLAALGLEMGGMPKIQMFTMPTSSIGFEGDQSVVYPNWEGIEQVQQAFKETSLTNWEPPAPYQVQ